MELFKHSNHRNAQYLVWLRKKTCVVSDDKAQCAHHIRLETNGGQGIKPSDYFCVPLLHEFHTTGPDAIHQIGEETFFKRFKLNKLELFHKYLKAYLFETHNVYIETKKLSILDALELIIEEVEIRRKVRVKNISAKKTKILDPAIKKVKISETAAYIKAKELKKIRDKELRLAKKVYDKEGPVNYEKKTTVSKSVKKKVAQPKVKMSETAYYQKSKEAKKEFEIKFKDQNKKLQSEYRKKAYQKAKELRKEWAKEKGI